MHIHLISIFPHIFDSFLETSLIKKAIDKKLLKFHIVNPRDFAEGKHQKVDDSIYGGGVGLLMKVEPMVKAVESIIKKPSVKNKKFKILHMTPSQDIFNQKMAHNFAKYDHLIFICTRYEGIDYRFAQYMKKKYKTKFMQISIGQFVTLGGELPAMTMIEATTRLVPGVIKEEDSRKDESYNVKKNMKNLEYPQYTKPDEAYGLKVPEVLLNGNHKLIQERREKNMGEIL